jgi:hypothetical protein
LVSLHVDWKSAVSGKLVEEIEIESPRLYLGLNAINYKAARTDAMTEMAIKKASPHGSRRFQNGIRASSGWFVFETEKFTFMGCRDSTIEGYGWKS